MSYLALRSLTQFVPLRRWWSKLANRPYLLALFCYLWIPVVLIGGVGAFLLIDPELARGHVNYARDYRWLALARTGVLFAVGGVIVALWLAVCVLVLRSRRRAGGWLVLAAAGPVGFSIIAMLEDRSPEPPGAYQRCIRALPVFGRVPLELAVCVASWSLAFGMVLLYRHLMITVAAFMRGIPAATLIADQLNSSGMWAFGEGLACAYLVVLIYLLWPLAFQVGHRWLLGKYRSTENSGDAGNRPAPALSER
jgi:hypothetical protein